MLQKQLTVDSPQLTVEAFNLVVNRCHWTRELMTVN
jgi:hypothetical protein